MREDMTFEIEGKNRILLDKIEKICPFPRALFDQIKNKENSVRNQSAVLKTTYDKQLKITEISSRSP
jgi:hypothetical protein